MPGSKPARTSPWNRCFKKLMPKSCPNLKTPWNRVCIRRMFPHLGKSNKCSQKSVYSCILPFMFLGLRNTCRFGPLTFFALLTLFALLLSVHQWLRSAIRDSQQPTSPIGFLFLKPRRAERRPTTSKNNKKGSLPTRLRNHIRN